jgi:hypothetical protein
LIYSVIASAAKQSSRESAGRCLDCFAASLLAIRENEYFNSPFLEVPSREQRLSEDFGGITTR